MASITIGGEQYTLGALKFSALKRAWPLIKKNQELAKGAGVNPEDVDPIEAMETAIGIIACALEDDHPELSAEGIEKRITAQECQSLDSAILDLMVESGFMQRTDAPGEAAPARGEDAGKSKSSTETSTAS